METHLYRMGLPRVSQTETCPKKGGTGVWIEKYLIYLNFNVVHFFGLIKLIKMVHREVVKLCENHAFLRALRISFYRDFRNILVGLENFQSSIL